MILTLFLAMQLRSVDLSFEGIECASCVESLPARIQRLRGVESAKVDAPKQILSVRLAAENRVRIEQIRDAVEQDGTKTREATVKIQGTLVEDGNRWLLKVPNGSSLEISLDGAPPSAQYSLKAGRATVSGIIKNLRTPSITPSSIESD